MRLLTLLTPVVMLGALWVLQRLEVWMSHPAGPGARGPSRRAARPGPTPTGTAPRRPGDADHHA